MGKKDLVCGIPRAVLDEAALTTCLEKLCEAGVLELAHVRSMTLEAKVKAMQGFTEERMADKESFVNVGPCDRCGQDSDAQILEVCPYCGDRDAPEEYPPPPEPEAAEEPGEAAIVHQASVVPAIASPGTGAAAALDQVVAEIRQLEIGAKLGLWAIGQRIIQIEEQGLWKQRLTVDGQVAYRNVEQFAREELSYSARYVLDIVTICRRYTRQQVEVNGAKKLRLLMQMTPEAQQETLDAARGGELPPVRELEKKLGREGKHVDPTKGGAEDGRKRAREPEPEAPKGKKDAEKGSMITFAAIAGMHVVEMFKKTSSDDPDSYEAATKIEDLPWGVWELSNDVRVFFSLVRTPKGRIKMRIDPRRIPPP